VNLRQATIWWNDRFRPNFFGQYRDGFFVQAALLVSMVVQNLIVPRALGAENYGILVSLTIWPNLMVGLAEPLVTAFMARARASNEPAAQQRFRFVFRLIAILAGIVSFASVFAARNAASRHSGLTALDIGLLVALSPLSFASVFFMAMRITGKTRAWAAAAYFFQAAATLSCFELPFAYGVRGALLLFVVNQVVVLISLFGVGDWRIVLHEARNALSSGRVQSEKRYRGIMSQMLAAISPRLMTILLSIISVLIASVTMTPADLGVFRVGVTIVNAAQYAVPINGAVLLVMFETSTDSQQRRRMAVHAISSAALVGGSVALLALLGANQIFRLILRHSESIGVRPYFLFASIPLFVIVVPVCSILIGAHLERVVVRSFALALGAFVLTTIFLNIEAAFVASCFFFLAPSAYAIWRYGLVSSSARES
jgi:O-antigen/teichoic acid export membrane protein